MRNLKQSLRSVKNPTMSNHAWQVEIFDATQPLQRERICEYIESERVSNVIDTLSCQLVDYLRSTHLDTHSDDSELIDTFKRSHGIESLNDFGVWVLYPWTGQLVHTLPQPLFHSLRTDRNRHKISREEQEKLQKATIGIVGLSAGLAVAKCMALEGVGGKFCISDFDKLDLSNLNRIQACIADIGLPKVVLAARSMLEINPFLDIQVYPDGISENNIGEFFDGGEGVDVLVEECDSLWMKIRLREEAKRRAIPVIMDTSDRGLVDVERFDTERNRPLFHNLIGQTSSESVRNMTARERIGFVLKILGANEISTDASASLLEIGQTISTWPQLGSAVTAGGAVVTDVVRRILLHSFNCSGRFSVDIESLVRDGIGAYHEACPKPTDFQIEPKQHVLRKPTSLLERGLDEQGFRWLVSMASMAPSGGNSQPWRFSLEDGSILGFLASDRRSPILDFHFGASYLAIGAAAENILLAAPELGLTPVLEILQAPTPSHPLFKIRFHQATSVGNDRELFSQIPLRCTNRRLGSRKMMQVEHIAVLTEEANRAKAALEIITDPALLDEIAQIIGHGDRIRLLSESMHREMMSELRWTPQEAAATRDGIDVSTLELSDAGIEVLKLLSRWPTMQRLRHVAGGKGLEGPSRDAISSASAFALLRVRSNGWSSRFEGGRALQRVWLRATSLGLSIQPMSVLVYLFDRIEDGDTKDFDNVTLAGLRGLRERYRRLFPIQPKSEDLLLFRIGHLDPPSARSIRLEVDAIIA